jgi:hypothetical protein
MPGFFCFAIKFLTMKNSKELAGMIGPTLIALTITEVFNSHIWSTVSATQTYLAGSLWFIAGLSIIRNHNYWTTRWPVLVTLIGWFAILGGLGRMYFPQTASEGSQNTVIVLAFQIVLLLIGVILTIVAYTRKV